MKIFLRYILVLFYITPVCGRNLLCKKESDCSANYCCAMTRRIGTPSGFCMPAKILGDQCAPTFIYGHSFTCGCKRGLTCALVEISPSSRHRKHRCVKVLSSAVELKEKDKMQGTKTKFYDITAEDLRKLLKEV